MMKLSALAILPVVLLVGTVLPDDSCHNNAMHVTQTDGPYVFYTNELVHVKYIGDDHGTKIITGDSVHLSKKNELSLKINTDNPSEFFSVRLKDKLEIEKAEYPAPSRQFVVSDIEGNFAAFRKLLQAGGVIDSGFNWTFGTGHLVLIGDFFDRGDKVSEVLWLIYSLEEKAKAAGGYVHFVLGNHEIMNMGGDLRYVHPKYIANAAQMNMTYVSLYGENSELGRWLRTKNIVEKIGGILYMHGGISAAVNGLNISLEEINKLARPYYSDSTYQYPNLKTQTIFGDFGPFWYRGYYTGVRAPQTQVDSTLTLFGAQQIVTGHTIVAEVISSWYGGKVIDTDVHHASGKSEALLIEGEKYYRVNGEGKKELL